MQFETFQERQSKYLKPLGYENYLQDREKYKIDLRKTKRREHFQKYRLSQQDPNSKLSIPPNLLKENPSLQSLNPKDHFPLILNRLKSRLNLKETLQYLINLLQTIESKEEDPGFFSELVELTSNHSEIKHLVYQALFSLSTASQICPQPGQMLKVFKEASGVNQNLLIFLCLNIIIDEKITSDDAEMIVSCIFIDDLAKDVYSPAAELLKVMIKLNFNGINMNPAFLWLVKNFSQERQGSWIDLLYEAYDKEIVVKTKKLLNYGLVEKILKTVQNFPVFTVRGLKILRKISRIKAFCRFFNDETEKILKFYLFEGENKVRYQAWMIFTNAFGKKQTLLMINDSFIMEMITCLGQVHQKKDIYCLKLLNMIIEDSLLNQTFLNFGFLKALAEVWVETLSERLNKEIVKICLHLVGNDQDIVHEFYQCGIFNMLEGIEKFYDEETEYDYESLLNMNPECEKPCISLSKEFRFS
jgi:hypothetical protein